MEAPAPRATLITMSDKNDNQTIQRLRELYPDLSEEEVEIAVENLRQYVAAVYRVHRRLYADPHAREELDRLTAERVDDGMETERSDS